MRKILSLLAGLLFSLNSCQPAFADSSTINPNIPAQNSPLASQPIRANFTAAYNDINNIYSIIAGIGGGSPGGSPGQLQYYGASGSFAGLTMSGDCLIAPLLSSVITCTKTNGTPFANSATVDTTNATNITSGALPAARLPLATTGAFGAVKPDGTSITISGGVISAVTSGGGTVSTTGSPANGNLTGFTGATSISNVNLTGDCTTAGGLATICTKSNGTNFATGAFAATGTSGATIPLLNTANIWSAVQSITSGDLSLLGSSSGNTILNASATAGGTLILPAASDTLVGRSTTDTLTNKSIDAAEINSGTVNAARLPNPSASSIGGTQSFATVTNNFLTGISTAGVVSAAQPATSNLSDISSFSLNTSGNATAAYFKPTATAPPTNGLYLPAANTPALATNSVVGFEVLPNSTGGNYSFVQPAITSGWASVAAPGATTTALAGSGAGNLSAGAYKYKATYCGALGETLIGTVSNTTTVVTPGSNGKIAVSAIPTSGSGLVSCRKLYRTTAGGSDYHFLVLINDNSTTTYSDNIADSALLYVAANAFYNLNENIAFGSVGTSDTSVGINYNSIGTTTHGQQYLGSGPQTSGEHWFNINGQHALELTDTYWNPNTLYPGPTNGWPVLSSGQGITNGGPGPDIIGAIYSVGASVYNSDQSGTATGASMIIASKGPSGQIHFAGNGWLGHVTITPPSGSNPNGWDAYAVPSSLILSGAAGKTGNYPTIFSSPSGDVADANIGMLFYNYGHGPFNFTNGNTAVTDFSVQYVASPVGQVNVASGVTGYNPIIWASSGAGNTRLTLAGLDTASVDIANGAQYNGTTSLGYIASFFGGFAPHDKLSVTAGNSFNSGPILAAAANDSDTFAPLNLTGLGVSGVNIHGTGSNDNAPTGNVGEYISATAPNTTATITVTIAAPGVVTWSAHGLGANTPVNFTTTGALPTGLTAGTTYYVVGSSITTNTFQLATSIANAIAGTSITTTGSQSGTQTGISNATLTTATAKSVTGISLTAGDWDVCGNFAFTAGGSTTATIFSGGIFTTVDTLPTSPGAGAFWTETLSVAAGAAEPANPLGCVRESLASTQTVYLTGKSTFATSTMNGYGFIGARRVR